jgi:hypothetical protein
LLAGNNGKIGRKSDLYLGEHGFDCLLAEWENLEISMGVCFILPANVGHYTATAVIKNK